MAIATDILFDYVNKRIYMDHAYVEATDTEYTSQELYTHVQNYFDELAQMDDTMPMSAQTPNAFTMINGWFIDDETIKWFKGGAIETFGWAHPTNPTGIRLLKLDATAGLTAADIGKAVAGVTTGDTGKLLAYDETRDMLWIRCDATDDLFDNASEDINVDSVLCGAKTAVSTTGENLYVNLYTLGTLTSASDTIYIIQNDVKIPAWWGTGIDKCDVLIKVKELGVTIDSGNVIVFCRYYPSAGNAALFDHFPITLTAGRQAVPLATAIDANNTSSQATVSAYGITYATAGPYSRNLNNGYGATNYDVEINCNGKRLSEMYEHVKYVCREGSTTQLFSDNGEEYIYANATYAPVKTSPLGTFAGGKFFGARGVWITGYHTDDVKNFQLISSNGVTQDPPNTVVCKISSVVSGDRCGMFMLTGSGGEIEEDTYTLDGQHLSGATTVTVVENIVDGWAGQDPPQAGYLRIVDTDGSEILTTYTAWTGKIFTLTGTLGTQAETAAKVWIPIIDAETASTSIENTLIQELTIYVTVRVRKKGIIPFEAPRSIGATGLDVPAVRTTDGIVL